MEFYTTNVYMAVHWSLICKYFLEETWLKLGQRYMVTPADCKIKHNSQSIDVACYYIRTINNPILPV